MTPWILSIAGALAAAMVVLAVRPDPRDLAHEEEDAGGAAAPPRSRRELWRLPAFRGALIAVAASEMAMVGVMGVTPNALQHLGHGGDVPWVISGHVAGMYAFAPIVGWLLDRWGRRAGLLLGLGVTGVGAVIAATEAGSGAVGAGLFAVGLGWSATFLGVTAVISDVTRADERAGALGFADLVVLVGSATAAVAGGVLLEVGGYGVVGIAATVLVAGGFIAVARVGMPRAAPAAARA